MIAQETCQPAQISGQNTHFLYPGMVFASEEPFLVTTILGSCVSVCLWDPVRRAGGMNHYLLPFWNGEGLQTPKFGNVAIPMLIDRMLALGSRRENLRAKVFGGANVLETSSGILNIGERNIMLAEGALAEGGIDIVSRDTGGNSGRKLMLMTSTGEVLVKKVKK